VAKKRLPGGGKKVQVPRRRKKKSRREKRNEKALWGAHEGGKRRRGCTSKGTQEGDFSGQKKKETKEVTEKKGKPSIFPAKKN